MNCPYCGAPQTNPGQFCMRCGKPLAAAPAVEVSSAPQAAQNSTPAAPAVIASPAPARQTPAAPRSAPAMRPAATAQPGALPPRRLFGVVSGQALVTLVLLWVARLVLTGLGFVRDLVIPDVDIPANVIVGSLVALVMMALLVRYASIVGGLWARAFPGQAEAGALISSAVWLILLALGYAAFKPYFTLLATEPEPLMVFQVTLVLAALAIAARACLIVYQALPGWLTRFRVEPELPAWMSSPEI